MSLPRFQSDDQALSLLQTSWASQLEPVLRNPTLQTVLLKNVALASGDNVVNHRLGRKLQGWHIVRLRDVSPAIYDTQDSNPTPQLTLNLVSSAAVVVDLVVF